MPSTISITEMLSGVKDYKGNPYLFEEQKEQVKQQAIANGTFMKAPNGKQSNLSEDLWLTVRTPNFKNWFGDWENDPQNASKVVDENGEPLIVYHGTSNDFRVFNRKVNYFTDNKDVANTYTGTKKIYEVFANIKNPITINANKEKWSMIDINNISIDGVDNIEAFLKQNGASVWKEKGALRTTTADILSAIEDNFKNKDGVIIKDIYDELNLYKTNHPFYTINKLVTVSLEKDKFGNFFYNLNNGIIDTLKKKLGNRFVPDLESGVQSPSTNIIGQNNDSVNNLENEVKKNSASNNGNASYSSVLKTGVKVGANETPKESDFKLVKFV